MKIVLVHGAWHEGKLMEPTAKALRAAGHTVALPTLAGNQPGDPKDLGLDAVIKGLVDYFVAEDIRDAVVVGHSYGGMVITGLADKMPERIRRLVYWNAFVPNSGEALNDLVPPHYVELFEQLLAEDGSVVLPFPLWREVFINDATSDLAEEAYNLLNPHPYRTFTDPISLSRNPAEIEVSKSYLNCIEDTAMPHSYPWHPRLSEKLGLFRLIQIPGSHELCFTDPKALANGIIEAGRD